MLKNILLIAWCGCLLFAACSTDKVAGSTETTNNKVGYKGLYGKLVDEDGKAVAGAGVKAISGGPVAFEKTTGRAAAPSSDTDSVSTDDSGYYSFESLEAGTYNLQGDYGNGSLVVLITDIEYDSAGKVLEVATDTLRAPGQISGRVNTGIGDDGGVMCYIPGTSFLAISDDTGGFTLSNIPQGTYIVTYRREQLKTASDTGVEVHSGETTVLPTRDMEADPAYPPPAPINLTVSYDTLTGCVRLSWQRVAVSDLAGYAVYRNDTASSFPQRVNDKLAEDTVYFDTVFFDVLDTTDRVLIYRIKAQDEEANVSTVYSRAVVVETPSPTAVRTFISLRSLNTIDDTASINDTTEIVASYVNQTRENVLVQWFIDEQDLPARSVETTAFSDDDTLRISWNDASMNRIYIAITDEGSTVWRDSTIITVVQDVPAVNAGNDLTVAINTEMAFSGNAVQRFGKIVIYKWDFEGDGVWDDSSSVSANSGAHVYTHETEYPVILYVRDDDGNEATDTLLLSVGNFPPKITFIRPDTTISINDSISFFGSAGDTDGTIREYAWDFGGDGTFEYTSATEILAGHRYDVAGIYLAALKVTDDDDKSVQGTVTVTVLQDMPVVDTGNDTIFEAEDTVHLHGSVKQQFGEIVKWEWNINGGNWNETTGPDTFFVTPEFTRNTLCSLAVTDDDGNRAADDITILSFRKTEMAAAGTEHSLILKTDNTLWLNGLNNFQQFGLDERLNIPTFVMNNVRSMAAGIFHNFIIKTDNSLWACGWNEYGQLGDGTLTTRTEAVHIMNEVKEVSSGASHTLILKTDHTLWGCGINSDGAMSNSAAVNDTVSEPVYIMSDVQSMVAADRYSLILRTDKTLWACGNNYCGQLCDGTKTDRATAIQVMTDVEAIAAGYSYSQHSLILRTDKTLWACGNNDYGQLCDGTTTNRVTPVQIMSDVRSASVGNGYSLILKTDGTLWACGSNTLGQLGDGTRVSRTMPVKVMTGVRSMASGLYHNLAVQADGSLWSWGNNSWGQLGDGTIVDRLSPVRIVPPKE